MRLFYLTIDEPSWLWRTGVPVMISRRRLVRRPPALRSRRGPWVLDSGGFTELLLHGAYTITARQYATEALRYHTKLRPMSWAAIQDWMCEPVMLAKTGLTVIEHQRRTVRSYLTLTRLEPTVPWLPVLQGFTLPEYQRCLRMYQRAGVSLRGRVAGIGSVCRRQHTDEIGEVLQWAHSEGILTHAFGLKAHGVRRFSHLIDTSDSAAWAFHAWKHKCRPGCEHKVCNHCLRYALWWRRHVVLQGAA